MIDVNATKSHPKKEPLIRVRHLKKRFSEDGPWVLDDINFDIHANETVAIIGTSGCGKSTLLNCIAGLETATEGTIEMNDPNFTLIFQYSALFDSMNVFDNIAFALVEPPDTQEARQKFKRLPPQEIERLVYEKLNMVGLENVAEKFPSELSGGMQKRVSFARGIIGNPRIILYDEPTSGLDPVASHDLEDYMNVLTRQLQAASVVVTHTISTICRTADRVILLNKGKIHWQGSPQGLLETDEPLAMQFAKAALSTTR
jgi:phospholipid/cholesterol/gamma-HCH transport system ATP-binding protein